MSLPGDSFDSAFVGRRSSDARSGKQKLHVFADNAERNAAMRARVAALEAEG